MDHCIYGISISLALPANPIQANAKRQNFFSEDRVESKALRKFCMYVGTRLT